MVRQTNTCSVSELKIGSKFVEKLLKYRIVFYNILTFLGLDYRDDSLITLYIIVVGIRIQNSDEYDNFFVPTKI